MKYILLLSGFFFCLLLEAQDDQEKQKMKVSFNQTSIGLSLQSYFGGSSSFMENNVNQPFNFTPQLFPTVHVGGMYLWGFAEMYFNLPIANLMPHTVHAMTYQFKQMDDVGIKLYPWTLKPNTIRPYFGISLSQIMYRQKFNDDNLTGTQLQKVNYPLLFGVSYATSSRIFEISAKYNWQNHYNYYTSKTEFTNFIIPKFSIGLSYKIYKDFEKHVEHEPGHKIWHEFKKHQQKNSFFVCLGPSSSYYLKPSPYNTLIKPYLGQHLNTKTFLEYSLGYHIKKWNTSFNIDYRNSISTLSAFGTQQNFTTHAFSVEGFKYLFDFHGLIPFAGMNVSYDKLGVSENEQGLSTMNITQKNVYVGFNLGIDIKFDQLKNFTIRSIIRYYPTMNVNGLGNSFSFQQLEVNYLQLAYHFKQRDNTKEK